MVEAIQSGGGESVSCGVVAVESVVFLVEFLKVMLVGELNKRSRSCTCVVLVVG